jgi:nitroreductase
VAVGVESILPGATVVGLASYWATVTRPPYEVKELCGFAIGDQVVVLVHLGWPGLEKPAPTKELTPITFVGD